MSSPNINNVLLCGCIMCYISVYIKTTEVSTGIMCKVCTVQGSCVMYVQYRDHVLGMYMTGMMCKVCT